MASTGGCDGYASGSGIKMKPPSPCDADVDVGEKTELAPTTEKHNFGECVGADLEYEGPTHKKRTDGAGPKNQSSRDRESGPNPPKQGKSPQNNQLY